MNVDEDDIVDAIIATFFASKDIHQGRMRKVVQNICDSALSFDITNLTADYLTQFDKQFVAHCWKLYNLGSLCEAYTIPSIKISNVPARDITHPFEISPSNGCCRHYRRKFRRRLN